jgi:hyperosmotically inducible protein
MSKTKTTTLGATLFATCGALFLTLGLSPALLAQNPPDKPVQPDNTKVNQRDRQPGEPTADQQKEKVSDRDLAQKVRQAIAQDKSLSTYAHNVKVIVQNGTVTLKGPVHSQEERHSLESKAAEIAGSGNVKDEMSVKSGS